MVFSSVCSLARCAPGLHMLPHILVGAVKRVQNTMALKRLGIMSDSAQAWKEEKEQCAGHNVEGEWLCRRQWPEEVRRRNCAGGKEWGKTILSR